MHQKARWLVGGVGGWMGVQYSEYGKYQHRIYMAIDLTVSHYAVLSFFFGGGKLEKFHTKILGDIYKAPLTTLNSIPDLCLCSFSLLTPIFGMSQIS